MSLLQTGERHLCARNVLFGVFEVLEQGFLIPGAALVLVSGRVREPGDLARFSAQETVQVGANLVAATLRGIDDKEWERRMSRCEESDGKAE